MGEHESSIHIREAAEDDASFIVAVLQASFAEYQALYTTEAFNATIPLREQIVHRLTEGPIWIALEGKTIVGTVSALLRNNGVYLRSMALIPPARGKGIGIPLLKQVEEFARRSHQERLFLSTTPFNTSAIRLYERFGFQRSDEGPYELFGTPLFTLVKRLTNRQRASMNENDQRAAHRAPLSAYAQKNRDKWEMTSDSYQQTHAPDLSGERAMAWGTWRIPEAELHLLGEVANKDVLELGCGAARWSIALAGLRARPVGLDISSRQLEHARRLMVQAAVDFPLIQASAEAIPLPDASFDILFCDWGTMTFCDPHRIVAEAARLLRPGGLFACVTATPIQVLCQDRQTKQQTSRLVNDYFGLWRLEWDEEVHFQLPYGEWIRLFRKHGLLVEDLIETQPPAGATSTYRDAVETEWARHWPMEHIWKVRKQADENR